MEYRELRMTSGVSYYSYKLIEKFGIEHIDGGIFCKYLSGYSVCDDDIVDTGTCDMLPKVFDWYTTSINRFIAYVRSKRNCQHVNFTTVRKLFEDFYLPQNKPYFTNQDFIFYSFIFVICKLPTSLSSTWHAYAASFLAQSCNISSINVNAFRLLFTNFISLVNSDVMDCKEMHATGDATKCRKVLIEGESICNIMAYNQFPQNVDNEVILCSLFRNINNNNIIRFCESDVDEEQFIKLILILAGINHGSNDDNLRHWIDLYPNTYIFMIEFIFNNWSSGIFDVRAHKPSGNIMRKIQDINKYITNVSEVSSGVISTIIDRSWSTSDMKKNVSDNRKYTLKQTIQQPDMYCSPIHERNTIDGEISADITTLVTKLYLNVNVKDIYITTTSKEVLLKVDKVVNDQGNIFARETWLTQGVVSHVISELISDAHFSLPVDENLTPSRLLGVLSTPRNNILCAKYLKEVLSSDCKALFSNRDIRASIFNRIFDATGHTLSTVLNTQSRACMEAASRGVKMLSGVRYCWNHTRDVRSNRVSYICTMCGNIGTSRYATRICAHADILIMTECKVIRTRLDIEMVKELIDNVLEMTSPEDFIKTCSSGHVSPSQIMIKFGMLKSLANYHRRYSYAITQLQQFVINHSDSVFQKLRSGVWSNIYDMKTTTDIDSNHGDCEIHYINLFDSRKFDMEMRIPISNFDETFINGANYSINFLNYVNECKLTDNSMYELFSICYLLYKVQMSSDARKTLMYIISSIPSHIIEYIANTFQHVLFILVNRKDINVNTNLITIDTGNVSKIFTIHGANALYTHSYSYGICNICAYYNMNTSLFGDTNTYETESHVNTLIHHLSPNFLLLDMNTTNDVAKAFPGKTVYLPFSTSNSRKVHVSRICTQADIRKGPSYVYQTSDNRSIDIVYHNNMLSLMRGQRRMLSYYKYVDSSEIDDSLIPPCTCHYCTLYKIVTKFLDVEFKLPLNTPPQIRTEVVTHDNGLLVDLSECKATISSDFTTKKIKDFADHQPLNNKILFKKAPTGRPFRR